MNKDFDWEDIFPLNFTCYSDINPIMKPEWFRWKTKVCDVPLNLYVSDHHGDFYMADDEGAYAEGIEKVVDINWDIRLTSVSI